ncbi:unnamed protein product [Cylicocyclus nassatus]|uniref:Uncharacterized protein n=1 Tax=Cylicocyclus nassatus TaxID=53992 RepID=A0AA36DN70_CYLNA|nr:unnamed protein product [Cylicocyclus nassatus]
MSDNEPQSQPDSTSEPSPHSSHMKTITPAPVPKTYIRMPKRGIPPNPMPENYVRLDQITDELYDMFCKEVIDEVEQECGPQERKLLDNMCSSGDFGAAVDFYDEILGELPVVMVHMRTSKVFLSPSLREKCIEKVIAVKKTESSPICAALAHIQQLFVGFPPEIRLRHLLVAELERQEPGTLSEDDKRLMALPPSARFTARPGLLLRRCNALPSPGAVARRTSNRIAKIKENADSKADIVTNSTNTQSPAPAGKLPPKVKPLLINLLVPLEDRIYDKIADVLAERITLESVEDESLRVAIENIRDSGEIMVEEWLEEQFFCPPGLRLRANDDIGRIYLRKSEVSEVWRMCYATLSERPQCEILNAVDAQYVGIATKANLKEVSKYDLLKGARVVFPTPPRSIGRKPMQYVQIDILLMEETVYGERSYSQALFLTDLYSGYCFARALTDCPDLAIIVRHVMDIFGSFGPPEAYRTYSLDYTQVIADVMSDIERLFKISIKNMGVGGNLTRDLVNALYKRAATELQATNRWVEALPFAVIEQNQRPSKFFDPTRTPFEIMFGRHAWRDEGCPPWVNPPADDDGSEQLRKSGKKIKRHFAEEGEEFETTQLDTVRDLKMYANSLVESRKRIKNTAAPVYVPVFSDEGKLMNPGTGYMFQIFDRVYVRNPHFQYDCRSSKQRPHIARYYRGIIVDIDEDLVDSMYKILYWEDDPHDIDAMSSSQWPAADDTYDCTSSWFGPWDVTASTAHLAKLRTVPVEYSAETIACKRRTIDARCRCDSPGCVGFANSRCPRNFSAECCMKNSYDCCYHRRGERHFELDHRRTPDARFNVYSHQRTRAPNTSAPAFHVKVENLASSSESSPYEYEMDSQKSSARSSLSSSQAQPEKRYTFRDGILVEVSDLDLEAPPRKGAPPVIRKRRITDSHEVVVPSSRSRDSWSAERDAESTTSQETHHVHFADPDPESATPSPTPSACYEVEISPGDSSQTVSHEVVSSVSQDTPRPRRVSAPRLRDDDVDHGGVDWDVPEISLRPRVVPRRDHPYERATPIYRPVSPTAKFLALNSMAQRLEKSAEKRYSARAAGKNENGTKAGYKLVPTSREATHVHPFDAEMMAEGKNVTMMDDVEQDPIEPATQTPVVTSTSVPRRIYVVKATVPEPSQTTSESSSK